MDTRHGGGGHRLATRALFKFNLGELDIADSVVPGSRTTDIHVRHVREASRGTLTDMDVDMDVRRTGLTESSRQEVVGACPLDPNS